MSDSAVVPYADEQLPLKVFTEKAYLDYSMAEREQLTVAEFREIFEQDLEVFSRQQMEEKLRDTEALGKSVAEVCRLMTGLIHYQNSCESIDQLIYRGPLDN